ncbi:MAG: hypothetical protein ACI8PD_002376, partial [Nitrospinales bacterium]
RESAFDTQINWISEHLQDLKESTIYNLISIVLSIKGDKGKEAANKLFEAVFDLDQSKVQKILETKNKNGENLVAVSMKYGQPRLLDHLCQPDVMSAFGQDQLTTFLTLGATGLTKGPEREHFFALVLKPETIQALSPECVVKVLTGRNPKGISFLHQIGTEPPKNRQELSAYVGKLLSPQLLSDLGGAAVFDILAAPNPEGKTVFHQLLPEGLDALLNPLLIPNNGEGANGLGKDRIISLLKIRDGNGASVLHQAAKISTNCPLSNLLDPLVMAAFGRDRIASLFCDNEGGTPLIHQLVSSNVELAIQLFSENTLIFLGKSATKTLLSEKDEIGETILHLCAKTRKFDLIHLFIGKPCRDQMGDTELYQLLTTDKSRGSQTPLDWLKTVNFPDINQINLLQKKKRTLRHPFGGKKGA